MSDVTTTRALLSYTSVNLSDKFVINPAQINNCFLCYDGNQKSKVNIVENLIGYDRVQAVNLYYIPDLYKIFLYDYIELDTTSLDVTITSITESLLSDLSTQINNNQVRIISM
jgi:hypothetical protein